MHPRSPPSMRSADASFYLPAVPSPKPAPTEQRRVRESRSRFSATSGAASRDLSLTCPLSGLDSACCVSVGGSNDTKPTAFSIGTRSSRISLGRKRLPIRSRRSADSSTDEGRLGHLADPRPRPPWRGAGACGARWSAACPCRGEAWPHGPPATTAAEGSETCGVFRSDWRRGV